MPLTTNGLSQRNIMSQAIAHIILTALEVVSSPQRGD
jgi:hypothetical protein